MNWLYYLLEANLYLILFYALYYLLLRRETWHQYNRVYLLASSALAFIIPVLQLGFLKPMPANELPPQLLTHYSYVAPVKVIAVAQPTWTRDDTILAIYLGIVLLLLAGLIIKIAKLIILSRKGTARDFGKWKIIDTNMERGAFTFFNYLFVSADMAGSATVISHELVHIRQKHSWDIIYLEIFRIINWFNPVAYLLQRSMKELHEFIADEANSGSKEQIDTYTDFLVANAYGAYEHQLTNNLFNQSLLKKRILMLHQKRSGNSARLKYLLVLPLLGGALCASTLAFAKDYGWIDIAPKHAPGSSETPGTKQLKFTSGGTTLITDKLSLHEKDGRVVTYTANTLTPAGKDYLLKKHKMVVGIYQAGDLKKYKEVGDVNIYASGATEIAPKISKQANADIRAKSRKSKTLLYQSSQVPGKTTTPLILINGVKYDMPENLKIGEYLSATATDSTVTHSPGELSAMKKWGSAAKNGVIELYGQSSVKIVPAGKDTIKSKVDKAINLEVNKQIQRATIKFPPPSVSRAGFGAFSSHLGKYTRYPANELEQRVTGNVVIELTINNDHKISDVKVTNDAMPVFANEVVRAAKLYTDAIDTAPGTYIMLVQFNLQSEKGDKRFLPKNRNSTLEEKSNFAGNVELSGFFKD